MAWNWELFSIIDDSIKSKIKLGNNSILLVMRKCVIHVWPQNGENMFIPYVYYVSAN